MEHFPLLPARRVGWPTPFEELNAVLGELVPRVRSALGERLVATYLVGSFALGDFTIDSDVDFLTVTDGELSEDEVAALQDVHAAVHDREDLWAKHLEGSYLDAAILNRADAVGVRDLWFLDNAGRSLTRDVHCNRWLVRWVAREHGIVLAGPDPKSLIDPVPADAIRGEARAMFREFAEDVLRGDAAPGWMGSRWGQPFAVLCCCRMLMSIETGRVHSKLAAARWAEERLGARWAPLVWKAWDERVGLRECVPAGSGKVGEPADPGDLAETVALVRYALQRDMASA